MTQSFNGGFEELSPNGIPVGWSIADPSGAATTKDSHLGKVAAKAWICKSYQPGVWNSKIGVSEGNASEVTGYYKYLGEHSECEKATVSYLLGARSPNGDIDTLAYGDSELKLSKDYRKFSLSVASMSSGNPDFVNLQFQPSGHCNLHGETNCCFLYVDDIVLAGTTSMKSAPSTEESETPKGKKGKKGEMEEEDGGGMPDSVSNSVSPNLENKGHGEITPQPEEKTEDAAKEEPEEEAVPSEEANPEEKESAEPVENPVEEVPVEGDESSEPVEGDESSEPVDEEWDSEEESSDGGTRPLE